jgi:carbamoyl-phosphate synthase large subunit
LNKEQNILFTCAGRRNYLINYFKEALNNGGKVFACDKDSTAPALKDADVAIIVPDVFDKKYITTLVSIIEKHHITGIISLNDIELPILAKNKEIIEKTGARLLISDEEVIDIAYDKWKAYNFLLDLNLKTPLTFIDLTLAKEALENGELQFPVVVKPRFGSASKNVNIAESLEELELIYKLHTLILEKEGNNQINEAITKSAILIQEKLNGIEFGLDVVNDFDKNYFGSFARRKLSMRCGETDKAESVIDESFNHIGQKLGEGLKQLGIMDCDLFVTKEGTYVLEMNPRFGGGYPFSHEAGANISAMYINWLQGAKQIQHLTHYKKGIIFSKCDRLMEIVNPTKINWTLEVVDIKNKKDLVHYKKLLNAINCNNPFYKIRVSDALKGDYGNRSCYFVFKKEGQPIIVMPFFLRPIKINGENLPYYDVSSPYGYSGPCFSKELPIQFLEEFWKKVDAWYKDNNVVSEFIRFSLNGNHELYTGTLIPALKNVRGRILDEATQWTNLKPKARNNYRKASQQNLHCRIYHKEIPENVITDFYDIYIKTMIRNNADSRYFYELDYFKSIIAEASEYCAIALIYKDGTPISTELILISKDTLYSFLGGTLNEYFYCRPNDFLKLEVMKWARTKRKLFYVLGGGRENGDGLYKYKKSFFPNDEDVIYYTGRKIINTAIYKELVMKRNVKDILVITDTIEANYFPLYRS